MQRRRASRRPAIDCLELEQRDGLVWPTLRESWAGRSPAEIEAAHQRAVALIGGGWGAVVWDAPQVIEGQQLGLGLRT